MYAPEEGSAHEWFEIFNNGDSEVDMGDFKFNDGDDGGHLFSKPPKNGGQGSLIIKSGEYAIIAKEADIFLNAHSGFIGTVIDGSLSLLNKSADSLFIFRIDDGEVIDTASYGENAGAEKNGLSLQLIDGVWTPRAPTPGAGSIALQEQEDSQTQSSGESSSPSSSTNNFPVESQIFASAGENKTVTVGADSLFKGEATGIVGETLTGARFVWNFGDGTRTEGSSVLHYYRYTGEYVVTLEVSSGEYSASDRIKISVREAKIDISHATQEVITIVNLDEHEIDLSWWSVVAGGTSFMLPQHTIILPQYEIHLSSDITDLHPINSREVSLQYPNGETVMLYSFGYKKPQFENTPISSRTYSYNQQSIVGKEITATPINSETPEETYRETATETKAASQLASVSEVASSEGKNTLMFWSALLGIIILGSLSVLMLRRQSREEITIIE